MMNSLLVVETPLLTVWRNLWVEVDSMGNTEDLTISGLITASYRVLLSGIDDIPPEWSWLDSFLPDPLPDPYQLIVVRTDYDLSVKETLSGGCRFEKGEFRDSTTGGHWKIIGNDKGTNATFFLEPTPNTTLPIPYETFFAKDDDEQPIDVPEPYTTLLADLFEPTFIKANIIIDDTDCNFDENCHSKDPDPITGILEWELELADDVDMISYQKFWVVCDQGMFQTDRGSDNDPHTEDVSLGKWSPEANASTVWMETARDYVLELEKNRYM